MPIGNRSASPRRRVPDERTARSSTNQPGDVAPAPFTLDSRLDPGRARHGSCEYSYVQAASKELDVTFPSNEDLLPEIELQNCPSPPRNVCLDYWEPSPTTDLVLCSPAIELYYFGETICRHLFVCDADDNPMRSVTIAQVRQSALYNSLLKYLTMEYFNTSVTTNEAQRNLHTAKADTHFYLQQAWLDATSTEEVLLATMMFGLSASWDGNNQTGADYYRRSLSTYHGIIENENKPYPNRVFHEHALMYWWSGLSFVIEKTPGTLPDPPTSSSFSSDNPPIFVHPLVGISPRSHRLMGEVGTLVYSQRSLALQHCFISMTSVREQEHMLHESQELEQALLAMHIPGPDDVVRKQSDDDTPAADLCNIAEAYRLCALLLLYRCFPDLLLNSSRLEVDADQDSADRSLSTRAVQALSVIERNGVTSRTKSVEQLLLLIIAGELTLPSNAEELSKSPYDKDRPHADQLSISSSVSGTVSTEDITAEAQSILEARALVCTRMSAIRNILPYKSVEQAEALMWDVWWRGDNGPHTFWMDAMIQRGLRFVMV